MKCSGLVHIFIAAENDPDVTAALKSLGIIPRTPSSTPLEERPAEELSPAEMIELLNRYRMSARSPSMDQAHISQAKEADALNAKKENLTGVKRELVVIDRDDEDGIAVAEERHAKKRQRGPSADD
jgi:hypothetical protein